MAIRYVTQAGAGAQDGTSLADAWSAANFNTAGNWGGGGNDIMPGDTVLVSGTMTTGLVFQGSGSSGSYITLLLDTGCVFTSAAWSVDGAIRAVGKSYLIVDGGTNVLLATSGVATILSLPTHNVAVTGGSIQTIVTGSVSASFDSVPIVNAQITGNDYLANISGRLNNTLGAPINVSGVVSTTVTVGNVTVTGFPSTIAPLAVSGVFSASVDNTSVILAIATGNDRALISNILLSGVSGTLTSNLTDPAYVTGQVGITTTLLATSGNATIINTAPIPVSGVTQANVTNAVLAVSGNVVSQITGWNTGLVVTTDVRSSSTAGNSTPSGAAPFNGAGFFWGQALAANVNRAELFVQNIHTGASLYVNLGSVAASTGAFSMILNPSTQLNWGGTSWGSRSWRGAVQVSGAAWIAWEI